LSTDDILHVPLNVVETLLYSSKYCEADTVNVSPPPENPLNVFLRYTASELSYTCE
jgi:hypothetical protein